MGGSQLVSLILRNISTPTRWIGTHFGVDNHAPQRVLVFTKGHLYCDKNAYLLEKGELSDFEALTFKKLT